MSRILTDRPLRSAGLAALVLVVAGCSSSAVSGTPQQPSSAAPAASTSPAPSTPATSTVPTFPSTPTSAPVAPTTQPVAPVSSDPPAAQTANAYWFTVGESFPGGAQWKVAVTLPSAPDSLDSRSIGKVTFDGPNNAVMLFQAPDFSAEEATSQSALAVLRLDLRKLHIHVAQAPQKIAIGPDATPAAFATGTTPEGKGIILAVARTTYANGVYASLAMECSVADFGTNKGSFNALLGTFAFVDQ